MGHWHASSLAGLLLTGCYRPICAFVYGLPDSRVRTAFMRLMEMAFSETDHCARVARTYAIGVALRDYKPQPEHRTHDQLSDRSRDLPDYGDCHFRDYLGGARRLT
ncbi:hypothetical protein KTN05_13680 [Paracoccus sp. Z118]|uniref:hypothetical protein n=1 Tax=Paracoccus sp. Z118 TaxID=2851017 RepID=UPI001C2C018B|nr:hypothetical protein [Paracoccus sp. Z118]MBV0892893.1 hypothetical protein [Paracoccus sp. Z118]